MYCLDSNVVIEILRGNYEFKDKVKNIAYLEICTTPITLCELYKGAFASDNVHKHITSILRFLESVKILNFDIYSCELYEKIFSELKKMGKLTQDFDLIIAAICIANNKILITKNKKHFENIRGLKIEEW